MLIEFASNQDAIVRQRRGKQQWLADNRHGLLFCQIISTGYLSAGAKSTPYTLEN
jgi:hypothetical protein